MLHSPKERYLAQALPALALTRPEVLGSYQATHNGPAARALRKGRPWVAVFVRVGDVGAGVSRMLFVGIYANRGARWRGNAEIMADPGIRLLHEAFGVDWGDSFGEPSHRSEWFDLEATDTLADLRGRLIIGARLTPTYVRLAESLDAPVLALLEEGMFETPPLDWRKVVLSAAQIRMLPPSWAARLAEWRGVYLIVDESDGARYVGAAYGENNLLGRWQAHVAGAQGVTRDLAARETRNFRFSILERVSPDMPPEDVIRLEQTWMDRLATRVYGLNA
ncbi:MAG: GIY-YIG nuclease family protein [Rhodobacteraceae bacterium]|nr:GIY-YIG nuclease family protein [Paracoccaceae bacterium]